VDVVLLVLIIWIVAKLAAMVNGKKGEYGFTKETY
jgi:hypothetical protein